MPTPLLPSAGLEPAARALGELPSGTNIVHPGCHAEAVIVQHDSELRADERVLFSVGERRDARHSGHAESSFAFLDRVAQPYWARIRDELDGWFDAFPAGEPAKDLRNRFRKDDPRQHYAAWWELYLYTFLRRSGFEVEVHPDVRGSNAHPDFLARSERRAFYIEAATTFSGIQDDEEHSSLEPQIMDAIERVQSETFTISLDFERVGTDMPRVRDIVRPIQKWLDGLDPDGALASNVCPRCLIEVRDWELGLTAFPLKPEHRGPQRQLIGLGPVTVGNVDDTEKLRAALNRKRGKYGDLDAALLFAVLLPSTFADLPAVEKALFGDTALQYYMGERGRERWVRLRNGFWTDKRGPRAQTISGVVTGFGILPGADFANRRPRLWPNPWATNPLTEPLSMPKSAGSAEALFEHQADEAMPSPREIFGLSADWPGPEPPFLLAPD